MVKLQEGRTKAQGADRDERGGIVWHTQGSGKSLSMVFLVRKMRMMPRLNRFKIVVVTDRKDLQDQLGATAQLSGETVRPIDQDLQSRESPTALTQRLLSERTPDIVMAMLQKYQPVAGKAEGKGLEVLPQPGSKAGDKVAMTIVRREKKPGRHEEVVEKAVTFTENIRFEEFPQLNDSEEILVLVDEAHRSHTRTLHRNLRKALPNAAIIGFSNQNPAYARKLSERLEEILQRFKDDWNVRERELRKFIEELRQGDRNDFPNLDAKVQVPFVRLVLEECGKGRELNATQRKQAIKTTLDMVERIPQEVRKVGFWKNESMRELLTRALVRDLNEAAVCRPGGERDLAQRLVALAAENHENLTRS